MLSYKKKLHLLLAEHAKPIPAWRLAQSAMISFTFDDFPKSALSAGGTMLKDYGWRGTYYCSLGLMGQKINSEPMFTSADLDYLIAAGHELGCHTFDHSSCFSLDTSDFVDACVANRREVEKIFGGYDLRNFSFPNGQATLAAKHRLCSIYDSCRSIAWGINSDPVDLGYLRANPIYSRYGMTPIQKLIRANVERKGWLILYTHDVTTRHSPYGCAPEFFGDVLRSALVSGSEVVTVREAVARFRKLPPS